MLGRLHKKVSGPFTKKDNSDSTRRFEPSRFYPYLFLLIYFVVLNYLVLHTPFSFFDVPNLKPVNQVSVKEYQTNSIRGEEIEGEAITLPDDWFHSKREAFSYHYQALVDLDPSDARVWAIYLPFVTHNAAVYVNGTWVGQGGRFSDPVARNHNRPLLFQFSSQVLEKTNLIDIQVAASHPRQGLMDQFYIAPVNELTSPYQWKQFVRVDLIKWFTLIMFAMAVILFCFWTARPQDKIYGLFALLLTIWAAHNLNLFVVNIPTSAHFWEAMTMSTLGWIVVTLIFFNHRYVGYGSRKVELIVTVFALLGMGIFLLPDIESILVVGYGVWDSFLIVFGSYAIFHLLRAYWYERDADIFLMLMVGVPILVFGFHDILTVNNLRDRREGLTIQYSVIPAAMLFSFFLIRRFVQSINQAEQLALTLEQRVKKREQELHQQYTKLTQLEQQEVLSRERERIMRDMHDGIGGQLVAVVTELSEQHDPLATRIRTRIQQSLTDLRLVIDSLDPILNDLSTLLGMMRSRIQEQTDGAGIQLVWSVTELPEMSGLSPQRSLHIMRIVQESVTNAIKHSNASIIEVSTKFREGEYVEIKVKDNGKGIAEVSSMLSHRGLKNMRYRAGEISGNLNISSCETGTSISLTIPLLA